MGGKRFLVSSSRAQPRDLFRLPFAVFLRKSICMKHRDPQSHEAYGVSRSPLPSQLLPDRERKRFLASARNDDAGKAAFSLLPLEGGGAAPEVGFALFRLRPTPCPSSIPLPREGGRWATHPASPSFLWKEVARSAGGWLHSQPLPIKKRTPASESANPSSQHQLDGFIVPILAKRRKVNHSRFRIATQKPLPLGKKPPAGRGIGRRMNKQPIRSYG